MTGLPEHTDRAAHHRQPRAWHTDATRPGFTHPDDRPSLAELEAAEYDDPFAGRARCRYGCRSTFITDDSPAALDHYTRVHGEQPPATDERSA